MERRDVDRWIADVTRATESRAKCLFNSDKPVEEVSISLATMKQLRAVSDAVGTPMTIGAQDSDSNPITREVVYNGARFWCRMPEVRY